MKSHIPDVNVWLSLHLQAHPHHVAASRWIETIDEHEALVFCRLTQMGLFRLLSNKSVMAGKALTMRECWKLYAVWIEGKRAKLWPEPPGLHSAFRKESSAEECSAKRWSDAYLTAFAEEMNLTLVTFDRALAGKTRGAVLLT